MRSDGSMEAVERDAGIAAVALLGLTLAWIHLVNVVTIDDTGFAVVVSGIPLLLALGIVVGAGWFRSQRLTAPEVGRVWAWVLVGVVAMVLATGWTFGFQLFDGAEIRHLPHALVNNVTGGAVFGLVLGAYDVSFRRRSAAYGEARRTLQRERDRFATLFENVPNPTIYYEYDDGKPIALAVNAAFESVFGYSESAVRGEPIDEYIVPAGRREEAARLNEQLFDRDRQVEVARQTTGGEREFLLSTVPLEVDPGRGFATYVDITDQRRRERRLTVLNRVLRHDLRNAMTVVLGQADNLVRDEVDPETAGTAIRERAEDLLSRSRKARDIEQLLDLRTPHRSSIDVGSVVRKRVSIAEGEYRAIDITVEAPPEPVWVAANDLLGLALDNLLENSARHAEQVVVTVTDGDPVVVRVRDDGPGIPESEIEVLSREEETQLEHTSGLGLWLVSWIVADVDGEMEIHNHEDGAEVVLRLLEADSPTEGTGVDVVS